MFLGEVYVKQGKDEAATAEYRRAISLDAHSVLAWSSLAEVYGRQGKLAEAADAYLQGLAGGEDANLRSQLAMIYWRQGKLDAALAEFEKVASLDSGNISARLMLGLLYGQEGRIDEAVAQYRQVLAVQPGSAEAHFNLAALEYKRCDLSTAAQEARERRSPGAGPLPLRGHAGRCVRGPGPRP